jgi:hypothetical protein
VVSFTKPEHAGQRRDAQTTNRFAGEIENLD